MVGAVADALQIAPGLRGRGTAVTMTFAAGQARTPAAGLEPLCRLALDTLADVSCVDLVRGGVLRRVAGEVDDEAQRAALLSACGQRTEGSRPMRLSRRERA